MHWIAACSNLEGCLKESYRTWGWREMISHVHAALDGNSRISWARTGCVVYAWIAKSAADVSWHNSVEACRVLQDFTLPAFLINNHCFRLEILLTLRHYLLRWSLSLKVLIAQFPFFSIWDSDDDHSSRPVCDHRDRCRYTGHHCQHRASESSYSGKEKNHGLFVSCRVTYQA